MKFRVEKNLRILNELITYFHKHNNNNIHIDIENSDEFTYFYIAGKIDDITEDELIELNRILNIPRQHEVEQYYWHLGGESELECELSLVGIMIDEAIIDYSDGVLSFKIKRLESE